MYSTVIAGVFHLLYCVAVLTGSVLQSEVYEGELDDRYTALQLFLAKHGCEGASLYPNP